MLTQKGSFIRNYTFAQIKNMGLFFQYQLIQGELKVLLYFSSMRHSSAALDVFAKVLKVMNQTVPWDVETIWYPLSDTRFASMAWNTALESMVLGLSDFVWSLRFLQPKQYFLYHLVILLWSTAPILFTQQMSLLLSQLGL